MDGIFLSIDCQGNGRQERIFKTGRKSFFETRGGAWRIRVRQNSKMGQNMQYRGDVRADKNPGAAGLARA